MACVDELPTVLRDLSVGERSSGPATSSDSVARLVQVGADAVRVQLVGAGQAGEPRTNDHHPRIVGRPPGGRDERRERRSSERGGRPHDANALQELTSRDQSPVLLDRLV